MSGTEESGACKLSGEGLGADDLVEETGFSPFLEDPAGGGESVAGQQESTGISLRLASAKDSAERIAVLRDVIEIVKGYLREYGKEVKSRLGMVADRIDELETALTAFELALLQTHHIDRSAFDAVQEISHVMGEIELGIPEREHGSGAVKTMLSFFRFAYDRFSQGVALEARTHERMNDANHAVQIVYGLLKAAEALEPTKKDLAAKKAELTHLNSHFTHQHFYPFWRHFYDTHKPFLLRHFTPELVEKLERALTAFSGYLNARFVHGAAVKTSIHAFDDVTQAFKIDFEGLVKNGYFPTPTTSHAKK